MYTLQSKINTQGFTVCVWRKSERKRGKKKERHERGARERKEEKNREREEG